MKKDRIQILKIKPDQQPAEDEVPTMLMKAYAKIKLNTVYE
jgi:hypothetical protein